MFNIRFFFFYLLPFFLFNSLDATYLRCIPPTSLSSYFSAQFGGGRSYENGYQAAGLFATYALPNGNSYCFQEMQLMRVDLGRLDFNYGMGWRTSLFGSSEALGVNVFYDARRELQMFFKQLGLGVELISKSWEIHFNSYLPFGKKEALEGYALWEFEDGVSTQVRNQEAMWGVDLEVGTHLSFFNCEMIYLGIGPYFYNTSQECACQSNAILGGLARGLLFWKCIGLEVTVTHDPYFRTKVQGGITFNLPFNSCSRVFYQSLRVLRNPVILTRRTCSWLDD